MARGRNAKALRMMMAALLVVLVTMSGRGSAAREEKLPKSKTVVIKNESGRDVVVEPAGVVVEAGKTVELKDNPQRLGSQLVFRDMASGNTLGHVDLADNKIDISVSVSANIHGVASGNGRPVIGFNP